MNVSMTTTTRTDVFLSYTKTDRRLAAKLATELEEHGLSIWWDAFLSPIKPFEETVRNVLLNTKIIVGVLSRTSLKSPWVRWELAQAHEHGLTVVPLLADGLKPTELPETLSGLDALFLADEESPNAIKDITGSIREIVRSIRRRTLLKGSKENSKAKTLAAERLAEMSVSSVKTPERLNDSDERDYLCSNGFESFLKTHAISIAFSSFPLSLLGTINPGNPNKLLNFSQVPDARGLHFNGNRFLTSCNTYILETQDAPQLNDLQKNDLNHSTAVGIKHLMGNLDIHDVVIDSSSDIIFANTRYSCLSRIFKSHGTSSIWQPPFISSLAPEDRCHLNGIATRNGTPAYVSAVAETDVMDGWRKFRGNGGVLIDVKQNRVICRGLSMPHSPRFYQNRLWALNSGTGELGTVNLENSTGTFEPLLFLPGFLRGLQFVGSYAIIGLSRPRHGDFEGLPLYNRLNEKRLPPWSGIAVVDIKAGVCVEWLRLTGRVCEVSDIAIG